MDAVRDSEYAEATKKLLFSLPAGTINRIEPEKVYEAYQTLNPKGKHPDDWWTDSANNAPSSKERVGYPTQKPLALLDRIIRASSNPGDVVLDPFCGCATTLVVADRLQRQWIGN